MARPLAVIGITYFLALLVANTVGNPASAVVSALLFLFFILALFFRSLRSRAGLMAALLAAGAAFCVYACYDAAVIRRQSAFAEERLTVTGRVTEEPAESGGAVKVTLEAVDGLPQGTRLYLWITDRECVVGQGDILTAPVRVSLVEAYGSGLLPSHRSGGVLLQAFVTDYEAATVVKGEPSFFSQVHRMVVDRLYTALEGDAAGLAAGICFGDTSRLSMEAEESFAGAGLSHLTAVSGLHLSIIAGAAFGLMRLLRIPRRVAAGLNIGILFFFMGLTLFPVSAVRAGIMHMVMMLGYVVSRKADGLNSLGLAVLLLVLFQPYAACDVGLLLSFAATLGLLTVYPWLRRTAWLRRTEKRCFTGKLASSLAISLSAMAFTMPVIGLCFGELSLVSPVSNLLAIPAASALLQTGCLGALLSFFPATGPIAQGLFFLTRCLARYLLTVADWLGHTPLSAVSARQGYLLLWLTALLPFLYLGWKLLQWRGVRMAGAFAAILLFSGMLVNQIFMRGVTTVTVLETGDGAALLLERDGHSGLVAAGEEDRTMRTVQYALRERGIRRLDFVFFPDADDRCMNGVGLLEPDRVDVVAAPEKGAYLYQLEAFIPADKRLEWPAESRVEFWNDCILERGPEGWLRLCIGDTRLLLAPSGGDASPLEEAWRETEGVVYSGKPPEYIEGIQAEKGIWSCSPATLAREEEGLPWRRYPIQTTAEDGDIRLMTRGAGDITLPNGG